jgi:hypothetical protein
MLEKNELMIHVGNGARVSVVTFDTMPLHVPSRLILELSNYYFVLVVYTNIISGYCTLHDGYSFKSENNGCSIYMNDIFYCHAHIRYIDLDRDIHIHNTALNFQRSTS